jgi:formylglycine-generating enzyme
MPIPPMSILKRYPRPDLEIRLIEVEGDSFLMGRDGENYWGRKTKPHQVEVPSFYLAEYPVTQELWLAVMGVENPARWVGLQRPVECVNWYDAAVFCNALGEKCEQLPYYYADEARTQPLGWREGKYQVLNLEYPNSTPVFPGLKKSGFRLPSEAEWEYAALGGYRSQAYVFAGGDLLEQVGWYDQNSYGETHPVGQKLPNELGLYDLSGNVWEWCEDQWYNEYSDDKPKDGSAWLGLEEDADRVRRGGCWNGSAQGCRPAYRRSYHPAYRRDTFGFRVALSSPPPV